MDKEQNIISDQPTQCQYLHGEEVSSRENGHVGVNERFPCGAALALWGWVNAVATQNISHRLVRQGIAQIGYSAYDSIVAPVDIRL